MLKKLAFIIFYLGHTALYAQGMETLEQYTSFLNSILEQEPTTEVTAEFYQRSSAFWRPNKIDYNNRPDVYRNAMALYHQGQEKFPRVRDIKIDRFEDTIERFRRFDNRNKMPENPILFVGSSSIVFWETANSFPEYPVINRGFGGASLPEVMYYYDDVIKRHNPSMMVVYCDIDVEGGKSPEFAVNAFKQLVAKIEQDFSDIPILILSMKPTLVDDILGRDVRANKLITNQQLIEYAGSKDNVHYVDITTPMIVDGKLRSDIFIDDGMHLNPLGYTLWDPVLKQKIESITRE